LKTHIVIIDDHILIADALAIMVNGMRDYQVLATYKSGNVFINDFEKIKPRPDIVILDVKMPEMDGAAVANWLSANHADIKILALSMKDDESDILKMIHAGAHGYLLKSIQQNELENALLTLQKQGVYYTQLVSKALAGNIRNNSQTKILNQKEKQLLEQLCTDLSYKEIAAVLNLSTRTIETYSNQLMEKFNVRGRIGLVLFAQQHQLI
jgi:DNA-binding NarL/FixJ family response regulator